jgi:sulfopyruvate decarboxylase TPP-binding subunit
MAVPQSANAAAETNWREDVYEAFKELGIRQVHYVPDAGHSHVIDRCLADPEIEAGMLANEFEGIGVCCGAWLGGHKAALLMQSSGIGNTVNALGLVTSGRFPFFTVITMRGEWGEFNPWQLHGGQSAEKILEASGVIVMRANYAHEVAEMVLAGARLAFSSYCPVAVLIGQRVIGAKVFK